MLYSCMFFGDPSLSLPSLRASLGSLGLAPTHSLDLPRACSFADLQLSTLDFQLSTASPSSSRPNCRIMNTCKKMPGGRGILLRSQYQFPAPPRPATPAFIGRQPGGILLKCTCEPGGD